MLAGLRIGQQFLLVLGFSFVLLIVAAGTAIFGMDRTSKRFVDFVDRDQAALLADTEMYAQGLQMGQALRKECAAYCTSCGICGETSLAGG